MHTSTKNGAVRCNVWKYCRSRRCNKIATHNFFIWLYITEFHWNYISFSLCRPMAILVAATGPARRGAEKPHWNSATGTRTRVARVRAEYPNQLDYGGHVHPQKKTFTWWVQLSRTMAARWLKTTHFAQLFVFFYRWGMDLWSIKRFCRCTLCSH